MWQQRTKGTFDGRMPFGKHKGELLEDVPESYLRWLLRNCDLGPVIRGAILETLGEEDDDEPEPPRQAPPRQAPPGSKETMEAEVQRLRRKYAASYHPDRGGSHDAMKAVNGFADELLNAVRSFLR